METRVIISLSKLSMSLFIAFTTGALSGVTLGIFIGRKTKKRRILIKK